MCSVQCLCTKQTGHKVTVHTAKRTTFVQLALHTLLVARTLHTDWDTLHSWCTKQTGPRNTLQPAQCNAFLRVNCTDKDLPVHDVLCAYALHCTQNIAQSAQCTLMYLHTRNQAHPAHCTRQLVHNSQCIVLHLVYVVPCAYDGACAFTLRSCELLRCVDAFWCFATQVRKMLIWVCIQEER
jgi:hypothetical protein